APDGWVAVVKPGRVLFELAGVTEEVAREAMRLASHKLPIDVKFIKRATVEPIVDDESAETADEGQPAGAVED
ncbi:MAG TPA: ribosomal protein L16, partial [Chthonomonadaceae bacterium]|nr:ribosomal protein L16 [Chthonomonadaceae bacterium]